MQQWLVMDIPLRIQTYLAISRVRGKVRRRKLLLSVLNIYEMIIRLTMDDKVV